MNKVGVIGAGSFGTTVATLLSHNTDVLIYSRRESVVHQINNTHEYMGVSLSERIEATSDIGHVASECNILFPVIRSQNFRELMKELYPYLTPEHILIHGTKGIDLTGIDEDNIANAKISRKNVHTMSEVILQETNVRRVGCLSGPNLSSEILDGQPTATVIASEFDEVIEIGKKLLTSNRFFVFSSHDLLGAELSGVLKNIIAIGSGILGGKNLGRNIQAILLTRGLREMIAFGKAMGSSSRAFIGTAGIGDLIATATSPNSRNYQFGHNIGTGMSLQEALDAVEETAEGFRTLRAAQQLAKHYDIKVPITQMIYSTVFEGYSIERAINYLMKYPFSTDVDFL
ncbi:MAG: NAD(P)H-dependent glycerol-3-phosphate dehydrogenase [Saprospiraceae bacterium]|nr:NAD(P)H-dependent glycerol-3-phosphate dehydrogenase [Saprospiraceae bacterium]